jgi:hypothetical protein
MKADHNERGRTLLRRCRRRPAGTISPAAYGAVAGSAQVGQQRRDPIGGIGAGHRCLVRLGLGSNGHGEVLLGQGGEHLVGGEPAVRHAEGQADQVIRPAISPSADGGEGRPLSVGQRFDDQ